MDFDGELNILNAAHDRRRRIGRHARRSPPAASSFFGALAWNNKSHARGRSNDDGGCACVLVLYSCGSL
ncbi:hypothetical protein GQ55_9G098000 [Panicum hallii var. hallii]|uniref:Uncharacterized protein n=1 Tax=Panicum hallii var. hallii TaxID=1504633 RepID=A0A2T7C1F7_9POAL|nr:hypothetical protein GQ55_9G098000 [Panicum hallii var. hallii]